MENTREDGERRPESNSTPFVSAGDVAEHTIETIEGVPLDGICRLGLLIAGENALVTRSFRGRGLVDPPHRHDDHESIGVLLSGRLKLTIDGQEFVAGPGDAWLHRRGVVHASVALEDCIQIEVKSPPRRTWQGPRSGGEP
jgi:quercetin dioxygenase-like cupin family protein